MSQVSLRRTVTHIGLLQIAIIVLAVVTALIHLDKAVTLSMMAGHMAPLPGGHHAGSGGPPGGRAAGGPPLLALLPLPLTTLFYLNFVGYIVLVIALYLPVLRQFQRIIRWLLIIYAAVTIILWFLITGGSPSLLGYIDKPIELALIVLLLIEDWQTRYARV